MKYFVSMLASALVAVSTGSALAQSSTKPNYQLERGQVQMIQIVLNDFGYDPGTIDGLWNEQTTVALRGYQRDEGDPVTGQLTATQACYLLRVAIATHGSGSKFPDFCRNY